MVTRTLILASLIAFPAAALAQERPARWQRRGDPTPVPVTVFHATHVGSLPTAETLNRGEWLFEISHRFLPPISEGVDALWGFDGGVVNRLGLAYAVHDRALLGVLRSNADDNLDINLKLRVAEGAGAVPWMVAVNGGIAWNTEPPQVREDIGTPRQYYAQVVLNALLADRLALGVIPSYLRNPRIEAQSPADAYSLGLAGQVYVSQHVSFLGEWNVSEDRVNLRHDAGTFGLELETGGHFFKVVVTNSTRMNPAQYLGGTPFAFEPDEWRVGFNITRLLTF